MQNLNNVTKMNNEELNDFLVKMKPIEVIKTLYLAEKEIFKRVNWKFLLKNHFNIKLKDASLNNVDQARLYCDEILQYEEDQENFSPMYFSSRPFDEAAYVNSDNDIIIAPRMPQIFNFAGFESSVDRENGIKRTNIFDAEDFCQSTVLFSTPEQHPGEEFRMPDRNGELMWALWDSRSKFLELMYQCDSEDQRYETLLDIAADMIANEDANVNQNNFLEEKEAIHDFLRANNYYIAEIDDEVVAFHIRKVLFNGIVDELM